MLATRHAKAGALPPDGLDAPLSGEVFASVYGTLVGLTTPHPRPHTRHRSLMTAVGPVAQPGRPMRRVQGKISACHGPVLAGPRSPLTVSLTYARHGMVELIKGAGATGHGNDERKRKFHRSRKTVEEREAARAPRKLERPCEGEGIELTARPSFWIVSLRGRARVGPAPASGRATEPVKAVSIPALGLLDAGRRFAGPGPPPRPVTASRPPDAVTLKVDARGLPQLLIPGVLSAAQTGPNISPPKGPSKVLAPRVPRKIRLGPRRSSSGGSALNKPPLTDVKRVAPLPGQVVLGVPGVAPAFPVDANAPTVVRRQPRRSSYPSLRLVPGRVRLTLYRLPCADAT